MRDYDLNRASVDEDLSNDLTYRSYHNRESINGKVDWRVKSGVRHGLRRDSCHRPGSKTIETRLSSRSVYSLLQSTKGLRIS